MAKNAKSKGRSETGEVPHNEIANRAFAIFERNGCQHGQDTENWLAAEAELKSEHSRQSSNRPSAK